MRTVIKKNKKTTGSIAGLGAKSQGLPFLNM
jgi:hypothetical protein